MTMRDTTATAATTATGGGPRLSAEDRAVNGRTARAASPRSAHGDFEPSADRLDPMDVIERQSATRLQELVPIRYGRMSESPFRFYRAPPRSWRAIWPGHPTPVSGSSCAAMRTC